jgi:GTPase
MVDAISGVTPADREVAQICAATRRCRWQPWPPVFLVVNKADSAQLRERRTEFYELGMGEPYPSRLCTAPAPAIC